MLNQAQLEEAGGEGGGNTGPIIKLSYDRPRCLTEGKCFAKEVFVTGKISDRIKPISLLKGKLPSTMTRDIFG